ncbi:hypothetical protein VN97_g13174, partial [Penicillium thymicola]
EARLEVQVQAFERHREWSRREAEAYHTIFRYLSPHISIHVAGLETSRDLWNELEERYRRMELATFCELFAQVRETTGERSAGSADFQETEDQYREGEGDDPLYPRTATPVDPGHGGRSSGSRRDWYGEAHALGEVQPTPGVEECVLRATRRDQPDQCTEVITRPLLGGGAPAEHLCATPRTGRTVGTAYHAEEDLLILRCHVSKRSRERVQLTRAPATHDHADSLEPQAVAMDVDDPQESSGAECAASTSELGGEAVILEEDACKGVDQASEALWHARMGHLNRET